MLRGPEVKQAVPWKHGFALFRRFWPYLRPERRAACGVGALLLLAIPSGIIAPLLVQRVFDVERPTGDVGALLRLGAAMAGLTLLSHALRYASSLIVIRSQNHVRHRLARRLHDHVLRLPLRFFHGTETGYVMSRMREDVDALDTLMIESLVNNGIEALRAALFFALLFWIDAGLAAAGLVLVAVVFSCVIAISPAMRRRSATAQEALAHYGGSLHQSLSGLPLVRLASRERGEGRRVGDSLRGAIRAMARRDVLHASVTHGIGLAIGLGLYVIVVFGAVRIVRGESTVGTLFAFYLYLMQGTGAATSLIGLLPALQRGLAALERIFVLFDEPAETAVPSVAPGTRIRGHVTFEGVSFRYRRPPNEEAEDAVGTPGGVTATPALHGITLDVRPGEVVAIVGRSGAGKSTLVNLVPRLFDPDQGRVLVDGTPLPEWPLKTLRRQIGVVQQDVFLFNRTVRENLAYAAPGRSEAQLRAAAEAAHAAVFIDRLPRGMETVVGERGVRLSGGEKQRLAIARELLRDPPILVLDEATSALDSESESLIQDALERLKRDRTCLVIAHRLSTVIGAHRIVVLEQGRIEEVGTHAELLERRGLYRRLHDAQALL